MVETVGAAAVAASADGKGRATLASAARFGFGDVAAPGLAVPVAGVAEGSTDATAATGTANGIAGLVGGVAADAA